MNPLAALLIGAGYGYLAADPAARKKLFKIIQSATAKGVDALNQPIKEEKTNEAD